MYRIIQKLDGTYLCELMIQDGTERWDETDLEEAKKSMKRAAKIWNGTEIKKKDIELYREEPITQTRIVRM